MVSLMMVFFIKDIKKETDLIFIGAQAFGFILCSFIPDFFNCNLKIKFPPLILLVFLFYLIFHFILGEIMNCYVLIKHFDSLLHFSSAVMLSFLAYAIVLSFDLKKTFSCWFVFLFCLCFSMSCGYLWELLEYFVDEIFRTNMQRYMDDKTYELLVGHAALQDTMKDMFLNFLGAFTSSIYIKINGVKNPEYFYIEYKKER